MNKSMKLAALLALAGGCSQQLPGGATYRMVSANNNPLPILLKQDSCLHYLHGGSVVFDGKGGYDADYDIRKTCGDSTIAAIDPGSKGTFEIRNDTAFFRTGGMRDGYGVITADSLVVRSQIHRLVYLRQR